MSMIQRAENPESGERGAILVFAAILLVVLFGFAALGVDATHAFSETRQAQSTADAAALAGGLEFLGATSPDNTTIFNTIKAYTNTNWGSKAPTDLEWTNCTDPTKPPDYIGISDTSTTPATLLSDCVSIKQVNGEPALLRVRLPDHAMQTTFAQVLGFQSVDISATATVEIQSQQSTKVLPFSIPADAGAEECMATPPSGLLPGDPVPCGGPTQGNFGMIDSPFFGAGDPHFTTGSACPSSPNFNQTATHNTALGLDHVVRETPVPPGPPATGSNSGSNPVGADDCAAAASGDIPYVMMTETGNTVTSGNGNNPSIMHLGFFGSQPSAWNTTVPGRLRQASSAPSGGTVNGTSQRLSLTTSTQSYTVDNTGLWEYLLDPAGDNGVCDRSTYVGLIGRELTERLDLCLSGASGQVFADEILDSPRFAVVPRLNYLTGSQFGTKWWAVRGLEPVYLQSVWFTCTNAGDNECLFLPDDFEADPGFDSTDRDHYSILFNPGEGDSSPCYLNNAGTCVTPSNLRFHAEGLSAFVLDWDFFPSGAEDQYGGNSTLEVFLHSNE